MAAKKPRKSRGRPGQPTAYRPEFLDTAGRLYSAGATDQEVADALGVCRATLFNWQHSHPEFLDASKLGKEAADDRVERALYHRAVGYTFDAVKIMAVDKAVEIVPYREHVPPDVGAATKWLANRRPDQWRDTQRLEHELVNVGNDASLGKHLTEALQRATRKSV